MQVHTQRENEADYCDCVAVRHHALPMQEVETWPGTGRTKRSSFWASGCGRQNIPAWYGMHALRCRSLAQDGICLRCGGLQRLPVTASKTKTATRPAPSGHRRNDRRLR